MNLILMFAMWTGLILRPTMPTQVVEPQVMTGIASRYDYDLPWLPNYSQSHRTCALRILPKYSTRKVCNLDNWKCVECYQNDYWPKEYTNKTIDLSSFAFSLLAPLSKWVIQVKIEKITDIDTFIHP